MRTKQPSLRITKWLRTDKLAGLEIPLEAECTACADAQFQVPFDIGQQLRKPFIQPNRERFNETLRQAFDEHVRLVHARREE
jgi:hypothetical protein